MMAPIHPADRHQPLEGTPWAPPPLWNPDGALPESGQQPAADARQHDANTQWVYIGPPEPWRRRFRWATLQRALKMLVTPEGWWRLAETLAALSEVNLDVQQRPEDPYLTISAFHRVTRTRFTLRGDGNLDLWSTRHLRLNGVLLLEQCSDAIDRNPTKLFGAPNDHPENRGGS